MSGEIRKEFIMRNNLCAVRQERGLSQLDLARMVGLSRQTISRLETNVFDPTLYTAFIIANALGVEVTDIFYLEDIIHATDSGTIS